MTPHFISKALARPSDFVIKTQASLRYFILRSRKFKDEKLSSSLRIAIQFLAKIQIGSLDIILPNAKKITVKGKIAGPHATLAIHHDRVIRKFLTKGKLGFCESYLDGDWSSTNMTQFFTLMLRNENYFKDTMLGKNWARAFEFLLHILRPNTKDGSKKNIYDHYDIGNDFYKEWLDPSMTYSSALFLDGITDLAEAQTRKYEEICRRLNLKAGMHILEIGCGWGGFAEYAAAQYGVKISGITISPSQYHYARERMKKAGLDHLVDIKIEDYRDVSGHYDGIVSIEMFEAVGESFWSVYFETLKKLLKPDAKAVLQIITINETDFPQYRRTADYIQKYIFPGGMLPTIPILKNLSGTQNLKWNGLLSFGTDYARTLNLWNEKFQSVWPHIQQAPANVKLNDRFKRLWEQYFCYCEAGFIVGTIDVVQITLQNTIETE